jgi:pyruvate ferredoxin oxidoreductase gamma subunit
VAEGKSVAANQYRQSDWIDFPFEEARLSAPTIHGAATSVQIKTGLWRTMRPVIDFDRCNRCWWICSTFCPDGAIGVTDEGAPHIDYDHCKGCLVCVAVCPRHAIEAIPEVGAQSSPRESVR